MTKKTWEFRLAGIGHKVELEHNCFSGKRSIRVDGRLLPVQPLKNQESTWILIEHLLSLTGRTGQCPRASFGI